LASVEAGGPLGREGAFFWLGVSLAKSLAKAGRDKEAIEFLQTVISQQSVLELQVPAAWALASLHEHRGEYEAAKDVYRQAAQSVATRQGKNLFWARCRTALFSVALLDGTAASLYEDLLEVLALRRSLAPGSAEVAASLSNLAVVESEKGDFETAAEHYKEALDISEHLEPAGKDAATILANYSTALWRAGDLGQAEQSARRSLELREQLDAGAGDISAALINLGVIVDEKGDLDAAEEYYSRALSLVETSAQSAPYKLFILADLGELYWKRGEYERAESFISDALSILGKPKHEGSREIELLNNLGIIEKRKGDYRGARSRFMRARQLAEMLAPNSSDHWAALENLALLDVAEGRTSSSIRWSRRALGAVHEFGPGSLYEARSLMTLGEAYLLQARYALAEESLAKALSILRAYTGCCKTCSRVKESGSLFEFSSVMQQLFLDSRVHAHRQGEAPLRLN
jgi:tetratricopeptide (TPR) repeat protein